ncbi:hypothetical protein StoSoilB20_22190 [Arthrobacter sp. StoSoilB20]|nr:hypothetical protein StoSoilB20_22190 [Arthrobacter sp. StoSoilB20]
MSPEKFERAKLTFTGDHVEHLIDAQATNKFILQISLTDLEPQVVQGSGPETGPAEGSGDAPGFSGIAETQQSMVFPLRSVAVEEVDNVRGPTHWDDADVLLLQVMTKAVGQRVHGQTVALAFHEHCRHLHMTSMADEDVWPRVADGQHLEAPTQHLVWGCSAPNSCRNAT